MIIKSHKRARVVKRKNLAASLKIRKAKATARKISKLSREIIFETTEAASIQGKIPELIRAGRTEELSQQPGLKKWLRLKKSQADKTRLQFELLNHQLEITGELVFEPDVPYKSVIDKRVRMIRILNEQSEIIGKMLDLAERRILIRGNLLKRFSDLENIFVGFSKDSFN